VPCNSLLLAAAAPSPPSPPPAPLSPLPTGGLLVGGEVSQCDRSSLRQKGERRLSLRRNWRYLRFIGADSRGHLEERAISVNWKSARGISRYIRMNRCIAIYQLTAIRLITIPERTLSIVHPARALSAASLCYSRTRTRILMLKLS